MKERRTPIEIKGKNSDEKFKHLEIILKRMARRMNQRVVGVMPPSIIFHYIERPSKEGIVLRSILPKGEITKVCIAVKKYNTKKLVRFICNIEDQKGIGRRFAFESRKDIITEDLNLSIEDVGFFTMSVEQIEEEAPLIEEIWISALYQFDQSVSRTKTLMLEELMKLEELDEGV